MAVELGTGYISLTASAQGLPGQISKLFDDATDGVGAKAGGKAGDDMGKSFLGSFGGVLKGGILAVGVAAGAALAKGVSDAVAAEQANDKLAAQLGLTAEQSEAFGRTAGKLYANAYGESLSEVNEALKGVQQNIGDAIGPADDALEKTTAKVLDLATAFDQDLGGTTAAVGQLLRTGLVSSADEAFDVLTVGFQQGTDKAGDLLDTITEYSTQFRTLGLDAKTSLGLLQQGLQAGARDADVVADALKEFAIRAQDPSLSGSALQLLGLNFDEVAPAINEGGAAAAGILDEVLDRMRLLPPSINRMAVATDLFGAKSEDVQLALFALDPSSAAEGFEDMAGAADRLGTTLNDNLGTRLESLKRTAFQGLAQVATTVLIPALDSVARFGERVGAAFREGGLGAVADLVTEEFRKLGPVIEQALEGLGRFIVEKGPNILRGLRDAWLRLGEFIYTEAYPALLKGAAQLLFSLGEWIVTTAAPYLGQQFAAWAQQFANWVTETGWPLLVERLGVFLGNLGGWLDTGTKWLGEKLVEWAVALTDWIVTTALPWAVEHSATFLAWFIGWVGDAAKALLGKVPELARAITDWIVTTALPAARDKLAQLLAAVVGWVTGSLIPGLLSQAGAVASAALEWAADAARRVPGALAGVGAEVAAWFRGLPQRIRDAVGDLSGVLYDAGRDVIQGLIDGIVDSVPGLRGTLNWVTDIIPFEKGPPSKDRKILEPAGRDVIGGFIRGIEMKVPTVRATLQAVAPAAVAAVKAAPVAAPTQPAATAAAPVGDGRWAVYLDGQELSRSFVRRERAGR